MLKTVKIKELGKVITGSTPSTKIQENFGKGYPFIKPPDLSEDIRYVLDTGIEISPVGFKTQAKRLLPKNTTCVVCIGTIGKLGLTLQPSFSNQQINSIIVNKDKYDPIYIYYLMKKTIPVVKQMNAGSASGRENVNKSTFENIEVHVLPLSIQRKISSVLSPYDDLIENNLKRIKILEEMAQNLYREWFVKFRFPGHEKVCMVDSPIGKIPEGWQVNGALDSPYFSLINTNISSYMDKKRYYATADIDGITIIGKGIRYTFDEKPSRAQKQPVLNSVWFARMQETYKVLPVTTINRHLSDHCMLSSGFAGFQARDEASFPFLFYSINSLVFHAAKDCFCTGATQRSLTNDGLSHIQLVSPKKQLVHKFSDVVLPIINKILILQKQNNVLRQNHDLLLPKLISGELNVFELDIKIKDAAT